MVDFEDPRHERFTDATQEHLALTRDDIAAFLVAVIDHKQVEVQPGRIWQLPDLY